MRIIDVDSHFMEPADWLEKTDPDLAAALPPLAHEEYSARIILGEAIEKIPAESRPPDLSSLLPLATHRHLDHFVALQPKESGERPDDPFFDGAARYEFCASRGIDVQFLNPSFGYGAFMASLETKDAAVVSRTRRAWNTYATEQVQGYADHLMPVAQTNLADVDWTVAELTRMREAGSRAFNIEVGIPGGKFLSHPHFERIWSAAEDLGMAAYVHAGILFDVIDVSWAVRNGRDHSLLSAVRSLGASFNVSIQLFLSALVLDGVFERHPNLVMIVAEAGHSWLPALMTKLDMLVDRVFVGTDPLAFVDVDPRTGETMVDPSGALVHRAESASSLSLRPSEYLQRQLRIAPLSGLAQLEPLSATLDRLPSKDMLVFSSDFPHPEGRADSVDLFNRELAAYDDETRTKFFGGSVSELLAV